MNADLNVILDFEYKLIYYSDVLCIKGKYEVTGFDDGIIVVKCGSDSIFVRGENLKIASLNVDEIHIKGTLVEISFNRPTAISTVDEK